MSDSTPCPTAEAGGTPSTDATSSRDSRVRRTRPPALDRPPHRLPNNKDWDRVQFCDEAWCDFDLAGRWRTITVPLKTERRLRGWKQHMESRGFETKVKKTAMGFALLARPDFRITTAKQRAKYRRGKKAIAADKPKNWRPEA